MESVDKTVGELSFHINRYNFGAEHKLVFLHGFTGSSHTWEEVIKALPTSFEILTVDLIGHGESSKPSSVEHYFVSQQIKDLHSLFQQLGFHNFTLIGYSMGGRLALAYSLAYPVERLILESSSPGIKEEEERDKRKVADELLAERIIREGIVSFIDYWQDIPLFQSQKRLSIEKQQQIREERLAGDPIGLANSLKGFSTGVQPSHWEKLNNLTIPTYLLAGELDEKFCRIGVEMEKLLPNSTYKEVLDAGHAIHVENPELFATIVKDIILEEEKQ